MDSTSDHSFTVLAGSISPNTTGSQHLGDLRPPDFHPRTSSVGLVLSIRKDDVAPFATDRVFGSYPFAMFPSVLVIHQTSHLPGPSNRCFLATS